MHRVHCTPIVRSAGLAVRADLLNQCLAVNSGKTLGRTLTLALLLTGIMSARSYGGDEVLPGWNLFQTDPTTTFLGLTFQGVPLGSYDFGGASGVQETGTTDTIIHRLNATNLGQTTTPITMDALQLETTAPTNFGGNGSDSYFVTLQSARGGTLSTGSMKEFDTSPGGSLDTESYNVDLFFDVRKGSLSGPIVESEDDVLSGQLDPWTHAAPPGTVLISGVNYDLNGSNNAQDFWPSTPFEESCCDFPGTFVLQNPVTPEPSSLALGSICVSIILGSRGRRRRAIA